LNASVSWESIDVPEYQPLDLALALDQQIRAGLERRRARPSTIRLAVRREAGAGVALIALPSVTVARDEARAHRRAASAAPGSSALLST